MLIICWHNLLTPIHVFIILTILISNLSILLYYQLVHGMWCVQNNRSFFLPFFPSIAHTNLANLPLHQNFTGEHKDIQRYCQLGASCHFHFTSFICCVLLRHRKPNKIQYLLRLWPEQKAWPRAVSPQDYQLLTQACFPLRSFMALLQSLSKLPHSLIFSHSITKCQQVYCPLSRIFFNIP